MIKKVKELAAHYWMDHKVEVAIFAILVVSLIIKQVFMYYGDSQDELQIHSNTDNFILFTGLFWKAGRPYAIEN